MKKGFYVLLSLGFMLSTSNVKATDNPTKFMDQLSKYCGKAFKGKIVTPIPADFEGKDLMMYVMSCEENEVKVPFFVGDDLSRTWIFTKQGNNIQLKHDHRKPDGSSDEVTMYGGTTANTGGKYIQFFPADQETAELIPAAAGNVWWVTVNDKEYTYNLKRVDRDNHFRVVFDLENPVETNKRPW